MRWRTYTLSVLSAATLLLAACGEGAGPAGDLPALEDITPVAAPYDENLDAGAAVEAAFAEAEATGKRVLLKLGGNWCPDCRILAGMFEEPAFQTLLKENYVYVPINVGRYDVNMNIPARFGFEKLDGVPTLLVVEPSGDLVNAATSAEWTNARDRDPKEVYAYVEKWARAKS